MPLSRRARLMLVAPVALLAALAPASAPSPAQAMLPSSLVLDDAARRELRRLEEYYNGVRTLKARFIQASSNGQQAHGRVYLSRPGRLRIEYDPPPPVLIVADGSFLIYNDRGLDQVSYLPLGATPAGILLADRVSLDDPALTVVDFTDDGSRLRLSLVRTDTPGEGTLTMVFHKDPLSLAEWEVTDAQGITTQVSLIDPQFGVALDQGLFQFRNPRLPGPGEFPSERP
ncbi:MAG: outer membrane lipoprotein carrier protein LolA [Rhodospirillales bacterium]